jgi:hypothetical protein
MKKRIPFFSVLGEKETYLNIVYILAAFPLSIIYFTLVVTGLSLSLGLLVIVAGFFIFIGTLLMLRGFRWMDVQLTRVFLTHTIEMKRDEKPSGGFSGFMSQLFGSALTWKSFVHYLVIKFPLDTVVWTISISFIAMTLDLLLAPALSQYWWFDDDDINRWLLDFFGDVYIFPFLGIIWGMLSLHVIRGLAWICREINQAMLGE